MSKKYDEYASQFISEHSSIDIQDHLEPRFQELVIGCTKCPKEIK